MAYPFGGKNFASSLTTLASLIGLITLIKRKNWVWITAVIVPFVLTFLAAALHRYPYGMSARVSQHLVPLHCYSRWDWNLRYHQRNSIKKSAKNKALWV
jgi:hypothetical protein